MPWSFIIPAAASVVGGLFGSDASRDAADTQAASAAEGVAEQRRQYDLTRTDQAPFRETGLAGNRRLAALLGLSVPGGETPGSDYGSLLRRFGLSDLAADPVYQTGLKFGLETGTGGINERARARGMYDSGATLKELTRYGTDYAGTKAGEARNRYVSDQDSIFNKLSGISGTGQVATNQVQRAGQTTANNVTGLIDAAGNARSAGIVGGANAWGGALGGVANAASAYGRQKRFDDMYGRYGGYDTDGRDY